MMFQMKYKKFKLINYFHLLNSVFIMSVIIIVQNYILDFTSLIKSSKFILELIN